MHITKIHGSCQPEAQSYAEILLCDSGQYAYII
jgi:hypothetical protein